MDKQLFLMKRMILLCVVCVLGFLSLICYPAKKAKAEENLPTVMAADIGKRYGKGLSNPCVSGVRISRNNYMKAYAYDVYSYTDATGWKFHFANLFGSRRNDKEAIKIRDGFCLGIGDDMECRGRFIIYGKWAKDLIKDYPCYSIKTTRYQKGEMLSLEYEYSTDSRANWTDSQYSLMLAIAQERTYYVGIHSPDRVSYWYDLNPGIFLGDEEDDVTLNTMGGEMSEKGEAYTELSNQYVIHKLPVPVRRRDRNVYLFDGWYTSADGGVKLNEGDFIEKGVTLYAHWKAVPKKCDVTCIDVLQTAGGEEVLGTTTFQAEYGELASGSAIGCSTGSGIYYPGRDYVGCSDSIVQAEGTVVYRYFKNASRNVFCIDVVQVGPDAGQQLGSHLWQAEYGTTVSGETIGSDTSVSAYYTGYRYIYSSMKQVGDDGCTVYRYFTPIMYNIEFVSGCASGGSMSVMRNLYYGHDYSLTMNSFINKKRITLDTNAPEASSDTKFLTVYSDFVGWAETATGSAVYYDGGSVNGLTSQEETVRLYAVWSGREATVDVQPKRLGYEFAGWSLDKETSAGAKQFYIEKDTTLYAVWTPAPVDYHIEYYKQRLDKTYERVSTYTMKALTGEKVQVGADKDMFPGFYLDEGSSKLTGIVKADGSLILNVYFQRCEYNVSFDPDGGSVLTDIKALDPIFGLFEQSVVLPEAQLQKTGYIFDGWTIEKGSRLAAGRPGETYALPNHDLVLYACWLPREDTRYQIIPYYENLNGVGYVKGETVDLRGTTDLSIEEDLLQMYQTKDVAESIHKMFGSGYCLADKTALEQTTIAPDGTTCVEIYLQRDKYEFNFYIVKDGEKQNIEVQQVAYGQKYIMPEKIEDIEYIIGYLDEQGEKILPGHVMMVKGSRSFEICQEIPTPVPNEKATNPPSETEAPAPGETTKPGTGGTDIPAPGETTKPGTGGTDTPAPGETTKPGTGGTDIPAPGETTKPGTGGTDTPAPGETTKPGTGGTDTPAPGETNTPSPVVTRIPVPVRTNTPVPVKTNTPLPVRSTQPPASTKPSASPDPSGLDKDGMSVISTWTGADSKDIASKLADSAVDAFVKKGTVVTKQGIRYKVTKSGPKTRSVSVIGINKDRGTVRIPAQISMRGYSYPVTKIEKKALAQKKKLTRVIVGRNVKQIGRKAFYNSRKLSRISFESGKLTKIEKGAWKGCSKRLRFTFSKSCGMKTKQYILKRNMLMK